ncbi:cysteine desulfurase family protein [Aminobacter sp. Piv2-1]|uniref:cysteine desulfurase family protein n=1 Tax=Aminobacter sp. Piv2-1 TaxID=3031122 RepID=UPI0030991B9A
MSGGHGVYMDYQASTPLDPRALAAMRPYLEGPGGFGNPHAADHGYGWEADSAVINARTLIAKSIGADTDEIVFTSGATEANNLALLGSARAAAPDRREVIVSAIEHKCVLAAARVLTDHGFCIHLAPVDASGIVDVDALANRITSSVAIVSVMTINNETGVTQPIAAIGELCRSKGVLFHSDAAQALAVSAIDVNACNIDLLSLSAHKSYGPKGIGALYVRRQQRNRIQPIMFGGGQEDGLRPGTLPVPLCVGFGAACALLADAGPDERRRLAALRDRMLDDLLTAIPDLVVNGAMAQRHPGNLNVRVPGVEAELLLAAARPNLAAATGSACTSGLTEPSHVLTAMGLSAAEASESVRLSLGRFTNEADVDVAVSAFARAVEEVRQSGHL